MITATPLAMIAAVALAATAPAPKAAPVEPLPKGVTLARLATPLAQPSDPVLDGRIWHCDGDLCRVNAATSAKAQSVARECESAAHTLGAFQSYQTGGAVLEGEDLARCNTHARAR
jgi:hypothetical protein